MIYLTSAQVTPAIAALFRPDEPMVNRCQGVLAGLDTGKILVDDRHHPTWGVVQEGYQGATYLGGELSAPILAQAVTALRRERMVIITLWPDDARLALLPPAPDYEGVHIDFYDRPIGQGLAQYMQNLPADCQLRRLDRTLIMRTEWGPGDVAHHGGLERWEQVCMGYCLMRGDEILCESTVGPPVNGLREPGVFTHSAHRGRGYATITSARLIHELESMGERTYWNCSQENPASAAVARKLGYRIEKESKVTAWHQRT